VVGIVSRDCLAKSGKAERIGIADSAVAQRPAGSVADNKGSRIRRLPDGHRNDRISKVFQPVGLGQHIHCVKRFDSAATGQ
jgi:hypothetical protein